MIQEFFSYFPPHLTVAWLVWGSFVGLTLIGLLGWSSKFWLLDATFRTAYLERISPSPQLQLEQLNIRTRNLKTVARIPVSDLLPTPGNASDGPPEEILVQMGEPLAVDGDAISREMSLLYPDATETSLDVLIMSGRFSWENYSSTHFENVDGDPVGIEKALNRDFVRDFVSPSRMLFCIGLASADQIEVEAKTNTTLSDDRAINLCRALSNLDFIQPDLKRTFAIGSGFGERFLEADESIDSSLQRSVALISIREPRRVVNLSDIVRGLVANSDRNGLSLNKYRRDDGIPFTKYSVRKGPLTGVQGSRWDGSNIQKQINEAFDVENVAK